MLASAVVMTALAIGVGLTSDSYLRRAVATNTELAEVSRQTAHIDDLTVQLVLKARQPPSVINTADLILRRSEVIEADIDELVDQLRTSNSLPLTIAETEDLSRRLSTALRSITNNAQDALGAEGSRGDALSSVDAAYQLFRDDLLRVGDRLETHEAAQLLAQSDSSRSLSQWVIVAAGFGVVVMGFAGVLGVRVGRRERDLTRRLQSQVVQDSLTGLANRRGLLEALDERVGGRRRFGALCFVDLDQFKRINDSLGHVIGDEVLRCVGERLRTAFPEPNVIARLGGDEFAVLVERGADPSTSASRAVELVNTPMTIAGYRLEMTASLGVRRLDEGDTDPLEALREADVAMYQAKRDANTSIVEFDEAMVAAAERSMVTEGHLREALRNESLEAHYQPMFDAGGGLVGAEALVRWKRGDRVIPPGDFLPLASRLGLMDDIDSWMLRQACSEIVRLNDVLGAQLWVSVNVDAASLADHRLVDRVRDVLAVTQMDPAWLMIEVTEQAAIDNVETAVDLLGDLQALGVRTALDDFGSGYSSLARLDRLPVDVVKIDRSLLPESPAEERRAELLTGIVAMARRLDFEVIAEGIETDAQLDLVVQVGCATLQGFHLGRPTPARDFARLAVRSLRSSATGDVEQPDPLASVEVVQL